MTLRWWKTGSARLKILFVSGVLSCLNLPVIRNIIFDWSGTLVDDAKGSRASATERTAYSCSSRSFEDFAKEPANAKSRSSSPVRRIVPARTLEVTRDLLKRTSSSGVAPIKLSTKKSQVDGYSVSKDWINAAGSISLFA